MKRGDFHFELGRKLVHLFFGLFLISILMNLGRSYLIIFLAIFFAAGSMMIVLMSQGWRIPVADWFEDRFEREDVRFPGYGAFWFVVGALFIAIFLQSTDEIAAALLVLAAGDSAATIFGVLGKHHLPHNQNKTVEGSAAFFIFSLSACLFMGWIAVALAALGTAVESLDVPVDDNLLIPIALIIILKII